MSAVRSLDSILPMSGVADQQATYRLLMASLGNFLGDLERARYHARATDEISDLPMATWQDSDHLYIEGQFQFQADSGREVDLHVVEGKFFIRLAKD